MSCTPQFTAWSACVIAFPLSIRSDAASRKIALNKKGKEQNRMRGAWGGLLLVACGIVSGQNRPTDVDGWGKVKWGMTLAQIKALYSAVSEESNEFWDHLTLPAITVSDVKMSVSVGAKHGRDKVALVSLLETFGLPDSPQLASASDFEALKSSLISKYGQPNSEDVKVEYGDKVTLVMWNFPSTSITLRLKRAATINAGILSVDYRAVDKQASDVL